MGRSLRYGEKWAWEVNGCCRGAGRGGGWRIHQVHLEMPSCRIGAGWVHGVVWGWVRCCLAQLQKHGLGLPACEHHTAPDVCHVTVNHWKERCCVCLQGGTAGMQHHGGCVALSGSSWSMQVCCACHVHMSCLMPPPAGAASAAQNPACSLRWMHTCTLSNLS